MFSGCEMFLIKYYCSNLYCSILWYDCSKTALKTLRIAYNSSLRKLLGFSESMCILSETDWLVPIIVF